MQYIESDTLMFISVVALVGWIVWLGFKRRRQEMELKPKRLQLISDAMAKFGTADQFMSFLQSPEGQAILYEGNAPEINRRRTNIRFVQAGTLCLVIGVGLLLAAHLYEGVPTRDLLEIFSMLSYSGVVMASAGVGLYVTAVVTLIWQRWFEAPSQG